MTLMLTPHELATLILLVDAPGQVQTDCADFNALLQYKLARADVVEEGTAKARATEGGCRLAESLRLSRYMASASSASFSPAHRDDPVAPRAAFSEDA